MMPEAQNFQETVVPSAPRLVSIVIPTFNRRPILQRCLDALTRQSYPNFEVIVVDDGSTDDTAAFLAEFAASHPEFRLRTIIFESHRGANPSRNQGIRASQGELIAFLDSDCRAEPDWLTNIVRGFSQDRVGGVSGLALDAPPRTVYERTFMGTHRIHRSGPIRRLIGCNMCVRRELFLTHLLDEDRDPTAGMNASQVITTVSGRGDEEGLSLRLLAAGYELHGAMNAVVVHDHPLDGRSFFRQAWRGGGSAARLVYKYHLLPRLDMLPFLVALLALPLGLAWRPLFAVSGAFLLAGFAALLYNDLFRKGKSIGDTVITFPVLIVYYAVRVTSYLIESIRLRTTSHGIQRVRLDRSPLPGDNANADHVSP